MVQMHGVNSKNFLEKYISSRISKVGCYLDWWREKKGFQVEKKFGFEVREAASLLKTHM